jgi:adenylate kinase
VSRRLVFLGPPGAGKGTQAQIVGRELGLAHVSTGDLLRKEVADGTPLGQEARRYMDRGELVPDDVVVRMVEQRIAAPDCAGGFILDGFPRTKAQAEALASRTDLDRVLFFDLPDSSVVHRLSSRRSCPQCGASYHLEFVPPKSDERCDVCGRPLIQREDDREETVLRRLREYRAKTADLIGYYRYRSLLVQIDADGSPAAVEAAVRRAIPEDP